MDKIAAIGEGGLFGDVVPALVDFKNPISQLALIGLVITVVLMIMKVKSAILLGILATTVIGLFNGVTSLPDLSSLDFIIPSLKPTLFKLDILGIFSNPEKTFGTFLGTGRKSGIFDKADEESVEKGSGMSSKLEKALFADATATSIGALLGTSNTTTYVESAAGISQGGRTGLTSVVTGVLFLLCLFIAPIAGMVPEAATAPALIVVGVLMAESLMKIDWTDLSIAIPAFLTVSFMPFTYSITTGVAAGFIFYCIGKLVKKEGKDIHPILYIVTLLFIASYVLNALI